LVVFIARAGAFLPGSTAFQQRHFESAVARSSSTIVPSGKHFYSRSYGEARERTGADAGLELLQVASTSDVSLGAGVA